MHERASLLRYMYIASLVTVKYTLEMLVGILNFSHCCAERKTADHHPRGCAPLF